MREIFETLARAVELNRKNNKGFTLVELLIVIAIIAILAAIAIPQFSKYKQRAYVAAMKNDAHNIISSEEAYFAAYDQYATGSNAVYNGTKHAVDLTDSNGNIVQEVPLSKNVVVLKTTGSSTDDTLTVDPTTKLADGDTGAVVFLRCPDGTPGYGFALGHENIYNSADGYYNINVIYNSCVDDAPLEVVPPNGASTYTHPGDV